MENHPALETPKLSTFRGLLTDGMVIAAATAFAYFASFVYEAGYCSHFAIPLALISPNTSTILLAIAAIGVIFVSSANLLGLTTPLFRKAKRGDGNPLWLISGVFLVALIVFQRIYDFTWQQLGWIIVLIFAIVIAGILLALMLALFEVWKEKRAARKIAERLDGVTEKAVEKNPVFISIDDFLESFFPPKAVRFFMLGVGVLLIAWTVGNGNATNQKKFLTVKDAPNFAVLRIYGDVVITASFDREKKELSGDISLVWLGDKKQVNFVNEDVGPLKLRPEPKKQQ